jgi:hypothetical protein
LLGLLFNPKNGGDTSLRNVCWSSPKYTAIQSEGSTFWEYVRILYFIWAKISYASVFI